MKRFFIVVIVLLFSIDSFSQQQVPDFTVTDTDGNTHNLYSYLDDGKIVVLDFFYVGCSYCQFYSSMIQQSYENYGCNNGDVVFLGIDWGDNDSEVMEFDSTYGITYPGVSGLDGGGDFVNSLYNITFYTTLMVIDTNKQIVKVIDPPTTQNIDTFLLILGAQPMPCNVGVNKNIDLKFSAFKSSQSTISLISDINAEVNIEIFDLNGRKFHNSIQEISQGKNELHFTNNFSKGIYIISLKNKDFHKTIKLIL